MRKLIALTACTLLVSATHLPAQEASQADFNAFSSVMDGRWIGTTTLVSDREGVGKRGDSMTSYAQTYHENDGHMLRVQVYEGSGSWTWTIAYDANAKRIRSFWVNSGGRIGPGVIYRDGENWIESGEGSSADGRKTVFTNVLTISNDGHTHTWTGEGSDGGDARESRNDVWRRVSGRVPPADGSETLQEFGELVVGRWVGEVTFIDDWPGQEVKRGGKVTGYYDFRWLADKHALVRKGYSGTGHDTVQFIFDPSTYSILFTGSGEAGAVHGRLIKLDNGDWLQTFDQGGTFEGKICGGAAIWKFSDGGKKLQFDGTITLDGKPLDTLVDVYEKVGQ